MEIDKKLGNLIHVSPRTIWPNEALDFTPWLAQKDNIQLLGGALGLDLEVIDREHSVGPYRSDIYARDLKTGASVMIENQLEATDHSHLGQILTYTAGLKTGINIWVSPEFTEEHLAAIDWLNKTTNENTHFFAVEIDLLKIDESLPSPYFNVVCEPLGWTRLIKEKIRAASMTTDKTALLDYWTAFKKSVESSGSSLRISKPAPQTQLNLQIGDSPFRISAIIEPDNKKIKALLWVSDASAGDQRARLFSLLQEKYGQQLSGLFGSELVWNPMPTKKWDEMDIITSGDPRDSSAWQVQHAWLSIQLTKLLSFYEHNLETLTRDRTTS